MVERTSSQMPLSSAFPTSSVCDNFFQLTLADLHLVSFITNEHLITTPPPSSLPDAGILAPHCWVNWRESSLIPIEDVLAPLSCLLYAGWSFEAVLNKE
jgi:hypothetical protein